MDTDTKRGPWGVAVPIAEDLVRIRIKNDFGLIVNSYLHVSGDTVAVFDPGWVATLGSLETVLQEYGLAGFQDVSHFVYTHTHIDHMGAAAILGEKTDAIHVVPKRAEPYFPKWHAFQDRLNDWSEWIAEAFAEETWRQKVTAQNRKLSWNMVGTYGPGAVINAQSVDVDQTVSIGGFNFEVLDAKGHDPYHLAFYDAARKTLFAGDVILGTPTPMSRTMGDDIEDYVDTLDRLEPLAVDTLLVGHGGHRAGTFADDVARSKGHVETLLKNTTGALDDRPRPLSDIIVRAYPDYDANPAQQIVIVSAVDNALQVLTKRGDAVRIPGPYYRAS